MEGGGREGGWREEGEERQGREGSGEWQCVLVLTFNKMTVDEGRRSENAQRKGRTLCFARLNVSSVAAAQGTLAGRAK